MIDRVLCAAVDIGSNTTRVLVAEPQEGQLRKVMEQRAYTRFDKDSKRKGKITDEKIAELAEVVTTQVRLAEELGAEAIRIVATAAIRESKNAEEVGAADRRGRRDRPVEVLSEEEEGRLAFIGATKTLGHPVEGEIGVVDVGGGSSEIILGTVADGVREVRSFKIGSGAVAEEFLTNDPPSASEIRSLRDYIDDFFDGVEVDQPGPGGRRRRQRDLAADPGRRGARVRDARARRARAHRRPDRRGREAVRARPAAGADPARRRADPREALRAARPAAADRQGRAARGDHPRPARTAPPTARPRRSPPTAPAEPAAP